MAVDPKKKRIVLVVHGVQTGSDADQNQHEQIKALLLSRLKNNPLNFDAEIYRYENVNDAAQKKLRKLLAGFAKTTSGKVITDTLLDLVLDVVVNLEDKSTAAIIRGGLRKKLLDIYAQGNPCYLVAHSLGSIYAFDVVKELMKMNAIFDVDDRKTWPLQGLLTIGSPIGLPMFKKKRTSLASLGNGKYYFRWFNYWDRTDPVVSGNIVGQTLNNLDIAEKYLKPSPNQHWVIRDFPVDTGKDWLLAHTAYWENPFVGDGLFNLVIN